MDRYVAMSQPHLSTNPHEVIQVTLYYTTTRGLAYLEVMIGGVRNTMILAMIILGNSIDITSYSVPMFFVTYRLEGLRGGLGVRRVISSSEANPTSYDLPTPIGVP